MQVCSCCEISQNVKSAKSSFAINIENQDARYKVHLLYLHLTQEK